MYRVLLYLAILIALARPALCAETNQGDTTVGPREQTITRLKCHGLAVEVSQSDYIKSDNYITWRTITGQQGSLREHGRYRVHQSCVKLDSNGQHATIIEKSTNAAHCCQTYYFIASNGDKISPLDLGDGVIRNARYQHGRLVLTVPFILAYWTGSYADSPGLLVNLTLQDGAFRLAPDIQRTAKPGIPPTLIKGQSWASSGDQKELAQRLSIRLREGRAPHLLWRAMLELVFTGHAGSAVSLFETVGQAVSWKPWQDSQRAHTRLDEFLAALKTSEYGDDLEKINSGWPQQGAWK